MNSDRRKRIEVPFQELVDLPVEQRRKVLADRCGEDGNPKRQVQDLLVHFTSRLPRLRAYFEAGGGRDFITFAQPIFTYDQADQNSMTYLDFPLFVARRHYYLGVAFQEVGRRDEAIEQSFLSFGKMRTRGSMGWRTRVIGLPSCSNDGSVHAGLVASLMSPRSVHQAQDQVREEADPE